jgi:hypothetical protein
VWKRTRIGGKTVCYRIVKGYNYGKNKFGITGILTEPMLKYTFTFSIHKLPLMVKNKSYPVNRLSHNVGETP